jgi:predicted MPP superfamily phosphohydrolase
VNPIPRTFSRRKFIIAGLLGTPGLAVADAKLFEPTWLKVRHLRPTGPQIGCRCVHFSDIHHKGDSAYLQAVVTRINSLAPDYVFFTGDLVEDKVFLPETLDRLSGIKAPMFGVPGNHDYGSGASFQPVKECFAATGGAWLMNQRREIAGGKINLIGITLDHPDHLLSAAAPGTKNILLVHYPAWVKRLNGRKLDLILAGHSHGGQVRIPFYGPMFVPFDVDEYDLGLFQTPAGPLYVNPGIGYLQDLNFRFNCRPEITVLQV